MAEKNTAAPVKGSDAWYREPVTIHLFRDNEHYSDDLFVGINGKTYQIQRGVDVSVPRFVAEVVEQSMQQDALTARLMEETSRRAADQEARG